MKTTGKLKRGLMMMLSLFFVLNTGCSRRVGTSEYDTLIQEESQWLLSLQLDNGSYAMTLPVNGIAQVNPYFACITGLALLESSPDNGQSVRQYLNWHFSHLNTAEEDRNHLAGTIYDYEEKVSINQHVMQESVVLTQGVKTYDSTDSYGALFLSLLWKYYDVTRDQEYLRAHKLEIMEICQVIASTEQSGLILATPDYPVAYLMDNCEDYQGLRDGAKLLVHVFPGEKNTIANMNHMAEAIKSHLKKEMWKDSYYLPSMEWTGEDYINPGFDWSQFYPDATSQLFSITCKVLDGDSWEAQILWDKFNEQWSQSGTYNWVTMAIPDEYYWGEIALGAAMVGDTQRANTYLANYRVRTQRSDHGYPLYNGDAAKVLMTACILRGE